MCVVQSVSSPAFPHNDFGFPNHIYNRENNHFDRKHLVPVKALGD